MEQRRLRLGDILDDYCPRERRLTNHAVVAMIEEDVKQTRCTTCDAEHAYKGGKVPKRRKKETTGGALQGSSCRPHRIARDRGAHRRRSRFRRRRDPHTANASTRSPSCQRRATHDDSARDASGRERRSSTRSLRPESSEPIDAPHGDRRRSRAPAAYSRAASAHRRAERRTPAAGVHDSSARQRRALSAAATPG